MDASDIDRLPKALRDLIGSGEALGAIGSGMISAPLAGVIGGVKANLPGGKSFPEEFGSAYEGMAYRPRSKEAMSQLDYIQGIMDKAKIPPVWPLVKGLPKTGSGGLAGLEQAMETVGRPITPPQAGMAMAVKQPGGHFTPSSGARLRELMVRGGDDAAPNMTGEWADTAIPRWLQKHAGTERDPSKGIAIAPGITLEQVVDRSLKAKPWEQMPEMDRPQMGRAGEAVWNLKPKPELERFLQHAGDIATQFAPEDLKRMDLPTLFRKVVEMDAKKTKAVAKTGDARQQAAARLMGAHPPGDVAFETDLGKWLRFTKGQDPEYVKQGLSVDTCFGDHCVASIGHGRPNIGYPGHVPVRDIVTGRNPLGEGARDTTSYIENVLKGKGDIYSLRTPEGIPTATMELNQPREVGMPRSYIRDRVMTKADYLKWQRQMRELGVPIEQHAERLPSAMGRAQDVLEIPDLMNMNAEQQAGLRAQIGGGKISPPRGKLMPDQIQTIAEMYPQYGEQLRRYMEAPPQEVGQYKGLKNRPVSPRYSQMTTDMLRQMIEAERVAPNPRAFDLERGGIFTGGSRLQSLPEAITQMQNMPVGQGYTGAQKTMLEKLVKDAKPLMGKTHLDEGDRQIMDALTNYLSRQQR